MNPTEFEQHARNLSGWISDLLAYHVASGEWLAMMRGLSTITLFIAWHASRGRHWTLRLGLFGLLTLLGLDALNGLAPGRLQYLTPAFIGRNVFLVLISYGLARRVGARAEKFKPHELPSSHERRGWPAHARVRLEKSHSGDNFEGRK